MSRSYEAALDSFVTIIQNSVNKNLNKILPQRLYEFFFESQSTDDDKYLIMCSVAKNFETFLQEIFWCNKGVRLPKKGLFDLTKKCGFSEFKNVLDENTKIWSMPQNGYGNALKYLSFVRNADAHGEWYIDTYRGDDRPESVKNVEKIKKFAALYVFAVAKYFKVSDLPQK